MGLRFTPELRPEVWTIIDGVHAYGATDKLTKVATVPPDLE